MTINIANGTVHRQNDGSGALVEDAPPPTGVIEHGDVISLTIADFGLSSGAFGADPEMELFDTVDNQAAYSGLGDGDAIPVGASYPWGANGGGSTVKASTSSTTARHSFDTKRYYCPAGDANDADLGEPTGWAEGNSHSDGIYVSWWEHIEGTLSGSESSKIIRIWGTSDGSDKYLSWTNDKLDTLLGGNSPSSPTPDGQIWDDVATGSWIRYEVWLDRRVPTSTVIRAWHDFIALAQGGQLTITADCSAISNPFIGNIGLDAGGASPSYPQFSFTDIYMSEYCKRIELTDSATWGSETHKEIQEVVTWGADSVQIKLFQGSFADLTGKHLHFIDENNAAVASVALGDL